MKNLIIAGKYAFGPLGVKEAEEKRVKDLKDVLMRPLESNEVLYRVYRGVSFEPHYDLRVDVTRLKSKVLEDGELARTHGHYHPEGPFGSWPEIYGVIKGRAVFILQDLEGKDVRLVEVREGETIVIPPGYGHVMVNVSDNELLTFNVVSSSFKPSYKEYKERRGPAVYLLEGLEVKYNPNYEVRSVKWCRPLRVPEVERFSYHAYKPSLEEWLLCE